MLAKPEFDESIFPSAAYAIAVVPAVLVSRVVLKAATVEVARRPQLVGRLTEVAVVDARVPTV
jgi:hypothetical protein